MAVPYRVPRPWSTPPVAWIVLAPSSWAVRHEAVIGTPAEQEAHDAEMAEVGDAHDGTDGGTMPHGEETTELHSVVVDRGDTLELTHTFESAGPLTIGCHEPGHREAGMKMDVDVT